MIRYHGPSIHRFPQIRWSFANFRQFVPTSNVWRGDGSVSVLPRTERTDYADPQAEVWQYARAGGVFPRPPGYRSPTSFYGYLHTLQKAGPHGQAFAYKSVNTEVLGWLIRRATGQTVGQVLSERVWQKLGAEQDACLLIDSEGTESTGGGFSPTRTSTPRRRRPATRWRST